MLYLSLCHSYLPDIQKQAEKNLILEKGYFTVFLKQMEAKLSSEQYKCCHFDFSNFTT
jgi:hypothetical protein